MLKAVKAPVIDRPRVRVRGRLAGEVTRVEFRNGGVDVVGIEVHGVVQQAGVVDLQDRQRFDNYGLVGGLAVEPARVC